MHVRWNTLTHIKWGRSSKTKYALLMHFNDFSYQHWKKTFFNVNFSTCVYVLSTFVHMYIPRKGFKFKTNLTAHN
jgi:hypothetical protein